MKSKSLFSFIVTLFLIYGCSSNRQADGKSNILAKNDINIRGDFQNYFDSCGVEGTIAIYDIRNDKWIVSDTVGLEIETLPASTFKIINLLIALETNTIKDENEIIKWVGSTDTVKYGYRPEIYHDMPVKEAFELSAGWVFVELAKKIGKDTYRKHLAESKYGNNNLSQTEADFWNFGDFAISPKNQVEFVKSFYEEKLPFSKRNIDIVKNVMITEQNEEYTIRAKTGWTRENNINTGWWTGYIETKNGTYIFATRLLQDRKMKRSDFGSCRKEITKNAQDIDKFKVFVPKAAGSGNDPYVLGKPEIADKGAVCSQTYMYVPFDTKEEAFNFITYLKTKFFRVLVSASKVSQDAPPRTYRFVPLQDFSKPWTDQELYEKYQLNEDEIAFIESKINPM